ncbi:transposase [Streptomyces sp. NBC_01340]|uniref:transposase n=1 Tax=Streptomyces sp. NBC_01340 TaxID=2903830 RepID=UPI003DA2E08C
MGRRKKINGRKRHLICDHRSLVLLVMITPADAQDSLAARELLFRLALMHPEIAIVWADSAYAKNGLIPLGEEVPRHHRQDSPPPAGHQGLHRSAAPLGS